MGVNGYRYREVNTLNFSARGMHGRETRRTYGLACLLTTPLVGYGVGFEVLRPLGDAPLLLVALLAVGANLLGGTIVFDRRYIPFFGYASMILGLSLARLMPAAWTHYYDASAAWRQWAWIGFLPAFIGAFRSLFQSYGRNIEKHAISIVAVLYVASRISRFVAKGTVSSWRSIIIARPAIQR